MQAEPQTGWLVLGANGQVGRALQSVLASRDDVTFWTRDQADLAQPQALKAALQQMQPTAIINAAAYTAVDKAEQEVTLAMAVNAESVAVLAAYCAARKIPLVHFSTDYVFDGSGEMPWREDDRPAPINAYGRSKLAGEQAIVASGCNYLIFRTSWVYDESGHNFVNTMLRLGCERELLNVVADQIGAPSYARHLAQAAVRCLTHSLQVTAFPKGIYHLCNAGETSWHGFAETIFDRARALGWPITITGLHAISTADYPTPAKRPHNSRLSTAKLHDQFSLTMPDWQDALAECLANKKEISDEAA